MALTKRNRDKRIALNAAMELSGFGIPWQSYDSGVVEWDEGENVCDVRFTHVHTGRIITVSRIWTDDMGTILQCGSNYGELTL